MTKDEALKMALELIQDYVDEYGPHDKDSGAQYVITAIKEALAQPEPNYKKALEVWLDKTEWVQKTVKPHELGMHRADVLKQRIEESLAEPEPWEKFCDSNCVWTDHHPDCKLAEQEPVATLWQHGETGRTRITMPDDITDCDARWFKAADLYTTPPQRNPLTDEEILQTAHKRHARINNNIGNDLLLISFARAIEAAHGIKGET